MVDRPFAPLQEPLRLPGPQIVYLNKLRQGDAWKPRVEVAGMAGVGVVGGGAQQEVARHGGLESRPCGGGGHPFGVGSDGLRLGADGLLAVAAIPAGDADPPLPAADRALEDAFVLGLGLRHGEPAVDVDVEDDGKQTWSPPGNSPHPILPDNYDRWSHRQASRKN